MMIQILTNLYRLKRAEDSEMLTACTPLGLLTNRVRRVIWTARDHLLGSIAEGVRKQNFTLGSKSIVNQ